MKIDSWSPLAFVLGSGTTVLNLEQIAWNSPYPHKTTRQNSEGRLDAQKLLSEAEITPRELKKMDRMAVLALFAARQAWRNSGCGDDDREGCGIMSGNAVAGWIFTEPELRKLYSRGIDDVSPYLASAWFPAAVQGQISIHMKLGGYAKTIATDRCAGTQAIGLAAEMISAGRGTHFLAGAAEAPLTPFVENAYERSGKNTRNLAEGAAYLVIGQTHPERVSTIGIYAHSTNILPDDCSSRPAYCNHMLVELLSRFGGDLPMVDVIVDSSSPADRPLQSLLQAQCWVREIWWASDHIGDSLAATGPLSAVAICARIEAKPDLIAAILVSIGSDFASAVLFGKVRTQEETNVAQ